MIDPNSNNPPKGSSRIRGAIVGALAGFAVFVIVFSVSDLELGVGRAHMHPIHLGFASVVIVLFVYLFSRRRRSRLPDGSTPRRSETAPSSSNMASLALVAFVGGPVLALAVGLTCVAIFNVHPMDRGSVVLSMAVLGFVVGTIVAIVLGVAGMLK